MNTKELQGKIALIIILSGWLLFAFLSPSEYSVKHWCIHIIFILIFSVIIILLFKSDNFRRDEMKKENEIKREKERFEREEDKLNEAQKRRLTLEEKLDELKDKETDRKIRLEKETIS